MAVLGLLIVAIVLIARNGLYGSIRTWSLANRRRAMAPPARPDPVGGAAAIKAGPP
jgi:hypothetical protein